MNAQISIPETELAAFCQTHKIRRFAIFGSALRTDFDSESDIDVLVEFTPGYAPGLLGVAGMEIELSELFGGRKVDLRTPEDLSRYFRKEVLDMAEDQYVQG
ncbi:MAG: nucleotidyltransferase family protein [Gemmatimonadetes bacterium]|nr:nucleotidyltransferase family protein [Gemmatimonadota bacterium]MXZ75512.1 nucleotidyltransferase family protein [Gemmatimonadota bacterium]MYG17151.1 nucleotidyltransferase family protein [Gemmatimonadota bacterium]